MIPNKLENSGQLDKATAMDAAVERLWRKEVRQRMEQKDSANVLGLRSSATSMAFGRDAARLGQYADAIFHFQSALPLQPPGRDRAEAYLLMGDCNHARKYEGAARVNYKSALDETKKDDFASQSEMHKLKAYCYAGLANTYNSDGNRDSDLHHKELKHHEYLSKAVAELNQAIFDRTDSHEDLVRAWNIFHGFINLAHLQGHPRPTSRVDLRRLEEHIKQLSRLL